MVYMRTSAGRFTNDPTDSRDMPDLLAALNMVKQYIPNPGGFSYRDFDDMKRSYLRMTFFDRTDWRDSTVAISIWPEGHPSWLVV